MVVTITKSFWVDHTLSCCFNTKFQHQTICNHIRVLFFKIELNFRSKNYEKYFFHSTTTTIWNVLFIYKLKSWTILTHFNSPTFNLILRRSLQRKQHIYRKKKKHAHYFAATLTPMSIHLRWEWKENYPNCLSKRIV